MSTDQSTSPSPLLIGGSSAYACGLVGDFVNRLSEYDCGPTINIFCHPGFWADSDKNWSEVCVQALEKKASVREGFLPWCKFSSQDLYPYYPQGQNVFDLLKASNGALLFAHQLSSNRLIVSGANTWADANSGNCYSAKTFLDTVPDAQVVLVVENAYSTMSRLIKQGFSPKVAAKIWVTESALAAALSKIDQASERVHVLRVEDLLSEPVATLEKISRFLALRKTREAESDKLPENSLPETLLPMAREAALLDLARQQANLSPHHRDYLLGTTLKPEVLPTFACRESTPSGSELMYEFGYTNTIQKWVPVKLSKDEQQLRSPRASFINSFADYKKCSGNVSTYEEQNADPQRSRFSFFRTNRRLQKNQSAPNAAFFPLLPPTLLSPPESTDRPDLPPEMPDGDLDFAVVIGFFGRHEILELVVQELLHLRKQGFTIAVFLVCSEDRDFQFAEKLRSDLGCIGIRSAPNHPLGRKWQTGVDFARQSNPKHLVITGSDDLVSTDYLTHAAKLLAKDGPAGGFEFATPASWFLYELDEKSSLQGSLWELSYQSNHHFPLGAGRVFASRLLDRFDWQLFDEERDSGLDMQGYLQVKSAKARLMFIPSQIGVIISIKGNWQALNPTEKILSVPTIQSRSCDFEKKDFFQKHFQTDALTIRGFLNHSKSDS